MAKNHLSIWPVHNLVIFDCDSTLSAVEGIDELARMGGMEHEVASLTKRAMEGDIPLEAVYGHRLGATRPTREQVQAIAGIYRDTVVKAAGEVVSALQELGCAVFIVSGGLFEPVRDFGVWLGVPREHVFAVGMEYDQLAGAWWRYWEQPGGHNPRASYLSHEAHPLSGTDGKNKVIREIRAENPGRAMLIGDGGSDLEASAEVELFVGFGGFAYRQHVAEKAPVYIHARSMAPVLPLAMGRLANTPRFARLWAEGLRRVASGEVVFNDQKMEQSFWEAAGRQP
jgi:phosphoserine phosphatase